MHPKVPDHILADLIHLIPTESGCFRWNIMKIRPDTMKKAKEMCSLFLQTTTQLYN